LNIKKTYIKFCIKNLYNSYFVAENDGAASSTIEIHKNFSPLVQKKVLSVPSSQDPFSLEDEEHGTISSDELSQYYI